MIPHLVLLTVCYIMLLMGRAYTWLIAWFPSLRSANVMSGYPRKV